MPRPDGTFAGQGWSRAKEAAWERIFGHPETQRPTYAEMLPHEHAAYWATLDRMCVPPEPPHEDLDERADRDEAAGWGR